MPAVYASENREDELYDQAVQRELDDEMEADMNIYERRFLGELERFESFVERVPFSGCWIWLAAVDEPPRLPYGKFWINDLSRSIAAHRAAWLLFVGQIPDGKLVLHRCDVPCCVNPAHLFLGTNLDNTQDMIRKGRKYLSRGELSHHAKLTEEQARQVRDMQGTQSVIAAKFGISQTAVSAIKRGANWKHL